MLVLKVERVQSAITVECSVLHKSQYNSLGQLTQYNVIQSVADDTTVHGKRLYFDSCERILGCCFCQSVSVRQQDVR